MKYNVTKVFTAGMLQGLTITCETSVDFEVGKEYRAIGGSDYRVIACTPIGGGR